MNQNYDLGHSLDKDENYEDAFLLFRKAADACDAKAEFSVVCM